MAFGCDTYWKTVTNTLQDGIMIVDKGGVIVEVNNAFERMTEYSRDEVIGQPCTILNCTECAIVMDVEGHSWCALFRQGWLRMYRCMIMRKSGLGLPVVKNASLLHDGVGEVIGAVETITDISALVGRDKQIQDLKEHLSSSEISFGIVGTSPGIKQLLDRIAAAAKSDGPVMITGETGTGKELVARSIHTMRGSDNRPFIKVNCGALSESLLESELFGHVKGAFTGAHRSRTGRFEAAHGGDIFLDEIGDVPLSTQVKLLRVLEEMVIERVGDNREIHVDFRVICATNRDLAQLISSGEFREDLYYRINVIPINVPPLRERSEDVPALVDFFLERRNLARETVPKRLSPAALDILLGYPWPGNVRELRGAIEYACVTCSESLVKVRDLPSHISGVKATDEPDPFPLSIKDGDARQELISALRQAGGNRTQAAKILGVSRVTIWNRMKKYGLK